MMTRIEHLTSDRLHQSYTRIRHKSGLTVCVLPKRAAVTYAVLGVGFGANDRMFSETADALHTPLAYMAAPPASVYRVPAGCAHFLEHKMFAERGGEDAIARFARYGANADAYTTPDLTAYLFSTTEDPYAPLEILLDFVTHPYFTAKNVAKERSIIAQEIRMYDDSPMQTGYYNLMEALYHTHPIRDNVGGTEETIREISPDVLYRCHSAFYRLDNMVLSVAGNVTPEQVLDVCDRCLPDVPTPNTTQRIYLPEPPSIVRSEISASAGAAVPLLYFGIKDTLLSSDPTERLKHASAVDILNDILFCKSSAIFADLYGRGLINGRFGAEYEHTETYSYALISAETEQPEAVADAIRTYLADRVRLHDITDAQFDRCRRVMYASSVTAYESTEDMALDSLDCTMDGSELFSSVDVMMQITKDDLIDALDSLYQPERMAVSVVTK
ncbi:MAG: insulinase family protein [Clostridia bacterium]|nr:insulinase family protein [Clostridia bacterium]